MFKDEIVKELKAFKNNCNHDLFSIAKKIEREPKFKSIKNYNIKPCPKSDFTTNTRCGRCTLYKQIAYLLDPTNGPIKNGRQKLEELVTLALDRDCKKYKYACSLYQ